MGIRISGKVGRHTTVSYPAWLPLLGVMLALGVIYRMVSGVLAHPVWALVVATVVALVAWLVRRLVRRRGGGRI